MLKKTESARYLGAAGQGTKLLNSMRFRLSDGALHTTLACCLAVYPCHPRAATSAGVHRNGVVAGLDVLQDVM